MKNCILTLLLSVPVISGFAQTTNEKVPGVSQETLAKITSVQEMIPLAYPYFVNWSKTVKYESVQIVTVMNGQSRTLVSKGSHISNEQKLLLASADPGSEIKFNIHFKHLPAGESMAADGKDLTIDLPVTAMPAYEAQYPGGTEKLSAFVRERMTEKVANPWQRVKLPETTFLFTITEQGYPVNIRLSKSTGNETTDRLLIETLGKMEKWQPAQNSRGQNVTQEMKLKFPFNADGC